MNGRVFLLAVAAIVRLCAAQQSGWQNGQVNATMCQWLYSRSAVVRDTLYIDGGSLLWSPGLSDGTVGQPISDGNPLGLVYMLNFSTSFNTSQNASDAFSTVSKGVSGNAVYNLGPQYYDGAMFGNDYEWMIYGGLPAMTDAFHPQPSDAVAAYQLYSQPAALKTFTKGYIQDSLAAGMTRYVSSGASVSIPSENLGFYFGGTRSASWGPIYFEPGPQNESVNADQMSLTLIEADMSVQFQETWDNYTLPSSVPGRADPEIVWIPVSEQGVLVAIGGVIFPSWLNVNLTNNNSATVTSKQTSPLFMTTVSVYDIANRVWYEQPTSGNAPGALTQGCTVVASAQDGSSHNIYWYGGFDGLNAAGTFNDNVYVLSVPSFVWTQVSTGNASSGRAGHRCTKPYPDQMIVIGGYPSLAGDSVNCLSEFIQIYNLSSNTWIDSYDPKVWSNYSVPDVVYAAIGGTATGGATLSSPSPSGFANSSMTALFGTPYNSTKITNWYPYSPSTATPSPTRSILPTIAPGSGKGTPSYLAPVLGVVLGLFFITLVILATVLWLRRNYLRNSDRAQSESGTMDHRRWVDRWLSGTQNVGEVKAPTVTTDEIEPMSPQSEHPDVSELDQGTVRYEMDATSKPLELHNQTMEATGFSPVGAMLHKNGHARGGMSHTNSNASQTESVVSYLSHGSSSPRPQISRGNSPTIPDQRIVSGVSNISETDRSHMRGISETSVSTIGAYATPSEGLGMADHGSNTAPAVMDRPTAGSPVTPLSATGFGDYPLAQNGPDSPNPRRSNFSEGLPENEKRA